MIHLHFNYTIICHWIPSLISPSFSTDEGFKCLEISLDLRMIKNRLGHAELQCHLYICLMGNNNVRTYFVIFLDCSDTVPLRNLLRNNEQSMQGLLTKVDHNDIIVL